MLAEKLSAWTLVIAFLPQLTMNAQSPTQHNAPAPRTSASQSHTVNQSTSMEQLQLLLNDPDVTSDPDLKKIVYTRWVQASCKSKQLQYPNVGADLLKALYDACVSRLSAQSPSLSSTPSAASNIQPAQNPGATVSPTSQDFASLDTEVGNIVLPSGCNAIPSPSHSMIVISQTPVDVAPVPMAVAGIPSNWLELNANSSGAELHTRSTVWVGYINKLRFSATLGGVVTVIQAPAIPNAIFPTVPTAPVSKPTNKGSGRPLSSASQTAFAKLNKCIDDIQNEVITFQQNLENEEIRLNGLRIRIGQQLSNLQPIVNTPAEAKGAADLSLFPTTTTPPFPLGDVVALRNLAKEVTTKYSQTAQWAMTSDEVKETYNAENATALAVATTLDQYLVSAGPANTGPASAAAASVANANAAPGNTGAANTGNASVANANGKKNQPPSKVTPPASVSLTSCSSSAISDASQEVNDYESNRCYVASWLQRFRTVAGADDLYFVSTYTPVCGGWFGQGTSIQMQLTVVDALNTTSSEPQNLDKIVCQPALTITNGVGLSFIPSKVPAFVAGVSVNSEGQPILDSTGKPTIIQTLGYSNSAAVSPGYAIQVNAALYAKKNSAFELHGALGAMLTASTGGTTTDILVGPALSFKKRAVFISPLYDLGLRTDYQNGFTVGMPQGNLTSPPTEQRWKSGFGLTITFPFTQSTSNQTSSSKTGSTKDTGSNSQTPSAPGKTVQP
jgi:hypothetical protein